MSIRCAHCPDRHETVAQVRECAEMEAHYRAEAEAEMATEARYERWLEDGGPHAAQIAWENEQDRLMHPFDPQVNPEPQPLHENPCVCGPYDRCHGVRVQDARSAPTANAAIRAMHRAYND